MPLVRVSADQLEAARQLYLAAILFINDMDGNAWGIEEYTSYADLVQAVDHCREEYKKDARTTQAQD